MSALESGGRNSKQWIAGQVVSRGKAGAAVHCTAASFDAVAVAAEVRQGQQCFAQQPAFGAVAVASPAANRRSCQTSGVCLGFEIGEVSMQQQQQ